MEIILRWLMLEIDRLQKESRERAAYHDSWPYYMLHIKSQNGPKGSDKGRMKDTRTHARTPRRVYTVESKAFGAEIVGYETMALRILPHVVNNKHVRILARIVQSSVQIGVKVRG